MDGSCSALIEGDWLTTGWLLFALIAGFDLGRRTSADERAVGMRWFNWVAVTVAILGGTAGFFYILDAPDDRCERVFTSIFFFLYPVAILGAATALGMKFLRR